MIYDEISEVTSEMWKYLKERAMNDYDQSANVPWDQQKLVLGARVERPRTRLERLKDARRAIEEKLKEVNAAIEALEANPEITKIMELVERAGF